MNLEDIINRLDSIPCVYIDDIPAVTNAIQLLKSQAARIADFEGRLGADQKPEGLSVVQVYHQTHSSDIESGQWPVIHARAIQDWHLWRPRFKPDSAVLQRSAEIRQQLGVVELEGNGFYMLPEKEDTP